ncbi:serine hydrolase, partial [Clavibacter michiganensis]
MSTNAGLDPAALERLAASIESDVESGLYDGAVILVARGGEVGLHRAVGYSDRSSQRATSVDDVFRIFSMTKTFTNALVLKAFDRGLVSPTTKVVDVIPEFAGSDRFRTGAKSRVSIEHLMTHRAA